MAKRRRAAASRKRTEAIRRMAPRRRSPAANANELARREARALLRRIELRSGRSKELFSLARRTIRRAADAAVGLVGTLTSR